MSLEGGMHFIVIVPMLLDEEFAPFKTRDSVLKLWITQIAEVQCRGDVCIVCKCCSQPSMHVKCHVAINVSSGLCP